MTDREPEPTRYDFELSVTGTATVVPTFGEPATQEENPDGPE